MNSKNMNLNQRYYALLQIYYTKKGIIFRDLQTLVGSEYVKLQTFPNLGLSNT